MTPCMGSPIPGTCDRMELAQVWQRIASLDAAAAAGRGLAT